MRYLILLLSIFAICFSSQNAFAQTKKGKTFTAKPAKVRDAHAPKQSQSPSSRKTSPDKTKGKKKKKGFKNFWAKLTKPFAPNRTSKTAKVRQRKRNRRNNTAPNSGNGDIDNIAVLRTAKKYMGVPYVWGGSTPNGFDCSGFVQYVWREHGYNIPRTSKQQSAHGKNVSLNKLKAGDLVFFGDSKNNISHVGMISSTRGRSMKMIHASSSKGISTIDINMSNYFKKRLQNARRIAR
ncbi:MAG: C40 family peptidase [Chitinophagales bacterium]